MVKKMNLTLKFLLWSQIVQEQESSADSRKYVNRSSTVMHPLNHGDSQKNNQKTIILKLSHLYDFPLFFLFLIDKQ